MEQVLLEIITVIFDWDFLWDLWSRNVHYHIHNSAILVPNPESRQFSSQYSVLLQGLILAYFPYFEKIK
jgi:hypothetical protein